MDPNLHVKKGIEHLERVLEYYPFVQDGGEALVGLTREDWQVVADMLFAMETPREWIPDKIQEFSLDQENMNIVLKTADCLITVEMF